MTDTLLANTIGLTPGELVELYSIDLNPIGYSTVFYFTQADQQGGALSFGGQVYQQRPIIVSGFEKSSEDAPPEPTLRLGNVDKGGNAILQEYGDLLGCKITRIQTFSHFLDFLPNGDVNPGADPAAKMLDEVWYVEQKVGNLPTVITWRLRSVLDLQGKQIPGRVILKDVCTRAYRTWDQINNVWVYPLKNACPYAGSDMFTQANVPTADPSKDSCSKAFNGCSLRFPDEPLPGWFFPGATRMPR